MATFVIGDIHGAHKALQQCLERSKFDNEVDTLISLGDVVDGWFYVYECVEILLGIKNLIAIKGNHDEWFREYMANGVHPAGGDQGSMASIKSYNIDDRLFDERHRKFFNSQKRYWIDGERIFVHGGFNRTMPVEVQNANLWWDRDLWYTAMQPGMKHVGTLPVQYKEIFLGHTSTTFWKTEEPMHCAQVWNLDTGAGWDGKLTIMNVDTKEYWQSDNVRLIYRNDEHSANYR